MGKKDIDRKVKEIMTQIKGMTYPIAIVYYADESYEAQHILRIPDHISGYATQEHIRKALDDGFQVKVEKAQLDGYN